MVFDERMLISSQSNARRMVIEGKNLGFVLKVNLG
jgi:hypothetical protein